MGGLAALPADQLIVEHGPASPVRQWLAPLRSSRSRRCSELRGGACGGYACRRRKHPAGYEPGHVPIALSRIKDLGEHVDNHQMELIRELERDGRLHVVRDVSLLQETVAAAPHRSAGSERSPGHSTSMWTWDWQAECRPPMLATIVCLGV